MSEMRDRIYQKKLGGAMFGYIVPNTRELSEQEKKTYRAWYCGLCHQLKETYGLAGQLSLSYEMTFLSLLLSSLYEPETDRTDRRCLIHPVRPHPEAGSTYTSYAAAMNVLLSYYKCRDDWTDERRFAKAAYGGLLRRKAEQAAGQYPRQAEAVRKYLSALSEAEASAGSDMDEMAGLFGRICSELFVPKQDEWEGLLRSMGFFLGKFIYLMDAWEDLEDDRKKGCFNPLLTLSEKEDYEEQVYQILTMMMAECSRAFERLPIIENINILRNILYSGVWSRYYRKKTECNKKDR